MGRDYYQPAAARIDSWAAMQRIVVGTEEQPVRLDVYLGRQLQVPRSQVRRILAGGWAALNGKALTDSDKGTGLRPGDVIELDLPQQAILPQPQMPLAVLAEGEGWAVVDKPAGVAVHPLRPGEGGTVLNAAIARWPRMLGVGEGGLRSGVVHRLDVDTSGVLALAMDQPRWEDLRQAFSSHAARKTYQAIVQGRMQGQRQEQMNLVIATHRPAKVRVVEPGRQVADMRCCDLAWRALEALDGATLLEIDLGTGFLHQIRVMMAHLGHPVLGDRLYAPPAVAAMAPRQMLHACRLAWGEMDATSPLPRDFADVLGQRRRWQ